MSSNFPDDPRFQIEKRNPNQTQPEWEAEILVKTRFERWQIPKALYEKMYSADATIKYMQQTLASGKGPGRPRVARNATYVKKRLADLVWRDCALMLGQAYMLPDGRQMAIDMQIWAEANGSRFKSPKG